MCILPGLHLCSHKYHKHMQTQGFKFKIISIFLMACIGVSLSQLGGVSLNKSVFNIPDGLYRSVLEVVYYVLLHELVGKIKVFLNIPVDIIFRVNLTFKYRIFWKTKNTNRKCSI